MVIRKALRAASSPSPAPAGCALVRLSAVPGRVSPQAQINLPLAVFYHPIQRAAFQCRKRRRLARVFLAILQTSFLNLPRLTRRSKRTVLTHRPLAQRYASPNPSPLSSYEVIANRLCAASFAAVPHCRTTARIFLVEPKTSGPQTGPAFFRQGVGKNRVMPKRPRGCRGRFEGAVGVAAAERGGVSVRVEVCWLARGVSAVGGGRDPW